MSSIPNEFEVTGVMAPPDPAAVAAAADPVATVEPASAADAVGPTAPRPVTVELSAAACARELRQRFPALFGATARPLKLHVQTDIQARAPGVFTRKALSAFLRRHTGSTSYLTALARGKERFDLDGRACGELSEEHRAVAAAELARRRSNQSAREAELEGQRRERAALLRDYETTTLTPANFCALKGLTPEALDERLTLARDEALAARRPAPRDEPRPMRPGARPPHHGPRRHGADR